MKRTKPSIWTTLSGDATSSVAATWRKERAIAVHNNKHINRERTISTKYQIREGEEEQEEGKSTNDSPCCRSRCSRVYAREEISKLQVKERADAPSASRASLSLSLSRFGIGLGKKTPLETLF